MVKLVLFDSFMERNEIEQWGTNLFVSIDDYGSIQRFQSGLYQEVSTGSALPHAPSPVLPIRPAFRWPLPVPELKGPS